MIKFFKHTSPQGSLYIIENLPNKLDKLALFLSEEVDSFGSSSWIRFLNTAENNDETSGNLMTLEKRGNEIYIGNIHYKEPEDEQEYFIISKHKLEKLMKQWEKLMEEKSDEITLSEHNGQFELVGINYAKKPTHTETES